MIPAPNSPDVWTISHIFDLLVKIFIRFAAPGQMISTYHNPNGVLVSIRILALIADLAAIRKVAGYLAHNAHCFCSFCLLLSKNIEELNMTAMIPRNSATVSAQAQAWKNAATITEQNRLGKESGVRFTPVHDIPGWDPVWHVVLGFMHNWLEGVVQHHLRKLWGIGRKEPKKDKDEFWDDSDLSESSSELDELDAEHRAAQAREQENVHIASNDDEMDVDDEESAASTTPTPSTFINLDDEDDEDDDEFYPDPDPVVRFEFPEDTLEAIRACIRDVDLPTWVARPPKNLGEAKHGKLKAQEYLTLFTVILPLVLPELWWKGDERERKLLKNFYHLVACTNILASFTTSNLDADEYTAHYIAYRTDLPDLFPGFKSMPNHHFAMHNGQLLKFWGPLAGLSEFPGERMNGLLGRVKHNRRVDDIPTTMIRQVSRRGRLEAYLNEEQFQDSEGHIDGLSRILDPKRGNPPRLTAPKQLLPAEVAEIIAKGKELLPHYYQMLLLYLRSTGQLWRDYEHLPHPEGSLILPPSAMQPYEFTLDGRQFSCKESHRGNSGIQFKLPAGLTILTGFIAQIWEIPLQGHLQTFLLVDIHTPIPEAVLSPFTEMPLLNSAVVYAASSGNTCIIEPRHILTHLTVYKRPAGTYGVQDRELLTISSSLNRGRRG
ncbi:hypothetical protein C8R43DRAFT_873624 [Mycena crocata]|nr:hypothetical protein C8R43DRAFT_873624 [Mycena crocata]